jgi:hypothetical protein
VSAHSDAQRYFRRSLRRERGPFRWANTTPSATSVRMRHGHTATSVRIPDAFVQCGQVPRLSYVRDLLAAHATCRDEQVTDVELDCCPRTPATSPRAQRRCRPLDTAIEP